MSAVCGELPRAGETVLIGPSAGPHFAHSYWFRVSAVRPSGESGWVYLDGIDPLTDDSIERSLFVRIEGLVIRR
ncbi:hypothetical protein [Actinocatenispora rupis]|nr:hypothetical protein [Actinocatenispora rupis]